MKDFRDLRVWGVAHRLTLGVYGATRGFPSSELYGLTSQSRRAAASIAADIAEGCGRGSQADFGRFLKMAMGSACELEYHLLLARDLHLLAAAKHQALDNDLHQLKHMLLRLLAKLAA